METINDEIFKVAKIEHTDNVIKADLSINPNCSIFKGHFPGQPVVPGACMLQIVKEVLESAFGQSLQLKKASQLKFIAMINPLKTVSVQLEMSCKLIEDSTTITGKLSDGNRIYFKFQTVFYSVK
jgi:3-hydroxyacyl-[acyl-carrier-protein] dehydratase